MSYILGANAGSRGEESCAKEIETTYLDNLGSYANMFDIKTYDSMEIYAVDIYTDVTKEIFYQIYTKPNSFKDNGGLRDLSVWTLLKEGSVIGRGFGNGTAIRDFDVGNLTIDAEETVAFYITLNTTDLRYRNISGEMPLATAGDIYTQNEDMEIHVGISIGEYPLRRNSTFFYDQRVWSGTLHYIVDRPCPSSTPSILPSNPPSEFASGTPATLGNSEVSAESQYLTTAISQSPSFVPSFVPSFIPSFAPSLSTSSSPSFPDITVRPDLQTVNKNSCYQSDTLVTPLNGTTGAYGSIFSVTSKEETLEITTLSFHTDFSGGNVTAIVYTKIGDFVGYENDPSAWKRISQSTFRGSGSGHGSTISKDEFESVLLYPMETASFYVTLTTADLRYSRPDTLELGDKIVSNRYLDVNAGYGLADYPFASEFFIYSPRLFNGIVHYDRGSDIGSACLSNTNVTYIFNIVHSKGVAESEIFQLVANRCDEVARGLMVSNDELRNFREEYNMSLDIASARRSDGSCNTETVSNKYVCTPVAVTLKIKCGDGIREGALRHLWRSFSEDIARGIDTLFETIYDGKIPVQTDLMLKLKTSSIAKEMPSSTIDAFEVGVLEFLRSALKIVEVLDAQVINQAVQSNRYLQRNDDDDSNASPTATLDISIQVVGEYRPPPRIDFTGEVEDAIDADAQNFEETIRRTDEFFEVYESIDMVGAKPPDTSTLPPNESTGGIPMTLIIILAVLLGLFCLFVGSYCYFRKKSKKRKGFDDTFVKGSDALKEERGKLFRRMQRRNSLNNPSIMDDNITAVQWTMPDNSGSFTMSTRQEEFYDEGAYEMEDAHCEWS